MSQQAKAGNVRRGMNDARRPDSDSLHGNCRTAIQSGHCFHGDSQSFAVQSIPLGRRGQNARSYRLGQHNNITGLCARVRGDTVGVYGSRDGKAVLRFGILDTVSPRK